VTFVSVVLPVRNEGRFIRHTLEQLVSQDYPVARYEVLVADGQSTDETRAIVQRISSAHPNVTLIDNPKRWSSAGRNAGVRVARGDVVVLVDGHCELNNTRYLADVADAFARSGADCVGRPQPLDVPGAGCWQRAVAAARASWLGHHPDSFIYSSREGFVKPQSVAVAYRRSVFSQVGLFDESFDACEDVDFNHRLDKAGLRCFFTPRAAVRYHPRETPVALLRQMIRYGRGRVRLLRKHPDTFSIGGFAPAVFVLGILLGPALAWLAPWLAVLYAGSLGLYGFIVALTSLAITLRTRDLTLLPCLSLAFLAIHVGAGVGILLEGVIGAASPAGSSEARVGS
jgi:succinoglycan biosynthesis protein ExoA